MPSCQMAVSEAKYSKRSSLMDRFDFSPHSHLPSPVTEIELRHGADGSIQLDVGVQYQGRCHPRAPIEMNSSERDSERECRIWAVKTCLGLLLNSLR